MADDIKGKEDKAQWLVDFVKKYGVILSIVVSLVLAFVVGITVFTQIKASQSERAAEIYDTAIGTIESLQYVTNQQVRAQYFSQQINNLKVLVQSYPKTVPAVRARLFLGKLSYMNGMQDTKALQEALTFYEEAYRNAPNRFYKSLSLIGSGLCYEQMNRFKEALDSYREIADRYADTGFVPTALIGMGRSYEMIDQIGEALKVYERVSREYSDSPWVAFARGKLYYYSDPNSPARKQASANVLSSTNLIQQQ